MRKIILTRHGETKWNKAGRLQGQKNSDLTPKGQKQALLLGQKLKDYNLDLIISSSSGRAYETAEIINQFSQCQIIKKDELCEMSFGKWEGLSHDEIEEKWPYEKENFWKRPHLYEPVKGETFEELFERLNKVLIEIDSNYSDKNILVVCHGVVLKAFISLIEKKPLSKFWDGAYMYSTCINTLVKDGQDYRFIEKGNIDHLESLEISRV